MGSLEMEIRALSSGAYVAHTTAKQVIKNSTKMYKNGKGTCKVACKACRTAVFVC